MPCKPSSTAATRPNPAPAPLSGPLTVADTAQAIKQRLLDRVADSDDSHLTLRPADGIWQPWLAGVQIKVLRERAGVLSCLLRLAPGASLPPHRHRQDEECIVLAGTLRIGSGTPLDAGGYHLAHAGTLHARIHADGGATIFLRGAVPQADDVLR